MARRFGRESPVLAYWLAHSEGFRVESPAGSGVVDRVFAEPATGRATALAVRGQPPARRRQIVPATAFRAVDPARRVLEAERPLGRIDLGEAVRGFAASLDGDSIAAWLGRLIGGAGGRTATSRSSSRTAAGNGNGNGTGAGRAVSGRRSSSSRSS